MPKNKKELPLAPQENEDSSGLLGDVLFVGMMTVVAAFPAVASYAAERASQGEGSEGKNEIQSTVSSYQAIAFTETLLMGLLLAASEFTPGFLSPEQLSFLTLWFGLNTLLIMFQGNNLNDKGSLPPTGTGA